MEKNLPYITIGAAILSLIIFFSPVFYPNISDFAITILGIVVSLIGFSSGVVCFVKGAGFHKYIKMTYIGAGIINFGFLILFSYVLKVLAEYTP